MVIPTSILQVLATVPVPVTELGTGDRAWALVPVPVAEPGTGSGTGARFSSGLVLI